MRRESIIERHKNSSLFLIHFTRIIGITDTLIQKMYSESILTKETYGSYMVLSDPKQLTPLLENVNLQLDFDFGINTNGQLALIQSLVNASDKEEKFALGIENTTFLNNFNTPQFSLDPKKSGSIDYMEVFRNWKELFPDKSPSDVLPEEKQFFH